MPVQAPLPAHQFGEQLGEIPVDGCVQRANAGFLAPGQTKLSVCVDNIPTSTANTFFVPLPQPPAGKVWIITDLVMSSNLASGSAGQRFAITVGGITVYAIPVHGAAAPDVMNGMETQPDCPGGLQPVLNILGASTMNSFVNIGGVQQNIGTG